MNICIKIHGLHPVQNIEKKMAGLVAKADNFNPQSCRIARNKRNSNQGGVIVGREGALFSKTKYLWAGNPGIMLFGRKGVEGEREGNRGVGSSRTRLEIILFT